MRAGVCSMIIAFTHSFASSRLDPCKSKAVWSESQSDNSAIKAREFPVCSGSAFLIGGKDKSGKN